MIIGIGILILGLWLIFNGVLASFLGAQNMLLCIFLIMPFAAVSYSEAVQIWASRVQSKIGRVSKLPNFLYLVSVLGLPWYAFISAQLFAKPSISYGLVAVVSAVMIVITFVRIEQNRMLPSAEQNDQVGAMPYIAASSLLSTVALILIAAEHMLVLDLVYICIASAFLDLALKKAAKLFFQNLDSDEFDRVMCMSGFTEEYQKTTTDEDVLTQRPVQGIESKKSRYSSWGTEGDPQSVRSVKRIDS